MPADTNPRWYFASATRGAVAPYDMIARLRLAEEMRGGTRGVLLCYRDKRLVGWMAHATSARAARAAINAAIAPR